MPNKKKIKIAHLQLLPLLSGVQRVTLDEVTHLNRSLFDLYVICKEAGPLTQALEKAEIPFFCLPELVREISTIEDFQAFWKLVRLFQKEKFDILHTHSSKTGILGRMAGKLAGVPVVMHTVHGFAFPEAKNIFLKAFYFLMEWVGARVTDRLILLNQHDYEIAKKYLGLPESKLRLIPNGIDTLRYSPASREIRKRIRRKYFGIGDKEIAIGMVGRLWPQKNPECFVKTAIQLLQTGNKTSRFFLIGDGEERQNLENLIKNSGFMKEIQILGWKNNINDLLRGLDIFVLPSRWEGMSLAVLEAMATSVPVLVSDIPGNQDFVEEDVTGYLFNIKKETVFLKKLSLLLAKPFLRKRMGRQGREKIKEDHSLALRLNKMEPLYIELFKNKS